MGKEEQYIHQLDYSDISRALSKDFFRVFCVNTDTDEFIEFLPHKHDKSLDVSRKGADFTAMINDMVSHVYEPDQDMVRTAVNKQNVLNVLAVDTSFSLDYRTVKDGKPVYERMKVSRIRQDDPIYILIGLQDTDAHMQRLANYEQEIQKKLSYAAVSEALSSEYDVIFYVNTQTNEFIEYSSCDRYKELNFAAEGEDFFQMCRTGFSRYVFDEDLEVFSRASKKENLLKALSEDRMFLQTFRVVLDRTPLYVLVKVTKMDQIDDHHLVIGLINIDSSMPRIQKYEQLRKIANRDSLTGVKSKHAFTEDEKRINREIEQGGSEPFAVVVCDVNSLKKINDTRGHQAGDDYLRKSCKMICVIFAHSPVYRVGGDEFAVILTGSDYENRRELLRELHRLSVAHIGTEEPIVSGGFAEYDSEQDRCLRDIFERADAIMYQEKLKLKNIGAVTRSDETDPLRQELEDMSVFHIRKHLLIADDMVTNREILGSLLEDEYDILYASDGVETVEMLHKYKDEIALLLLDLYMPFMNGQEVLREMQVDEDLMSIPVIMLTIDPAAELDSLKLGAVDFISKPYPNIAIVKARIAKAIELSENRNLIRNTERDRLTGLLHYDYFIQYVERFEHHQDETVFDAFACDVKDFHAINEQYGRQFGDLVLRSIGSSFRKLARKTGGLGCRQGGDTFLLYCPHRKEYDSLIRNFYEDLFVEKETADKIKLRFGVFANAGQEPDIEERFVNAQKAAERVADDPDQLCGYYDAE